MSHGAKQRREDLFQTTHESNGRHLVRNKALYLDGVVKTSKLLATVISALDNNTQGQAAAGIQ
jgi:hypothetical protein